MRLLDPNINFDEESHRYYTDDGVTYISVSQLINKYKKQFDVDGKILEKCAAKKGVTPEELKKQWELTKVEGQLRGTAFHKSIEYYINTGEVLDNQDKDIVKRFSKIKFRGKLYSETIVTSHKHKVAGTCDLLELFGKDTLYLWDFKTNKKMSKYSPFGNKYLYPLDNVYESDIMSYSFQLSLYAFILEENGFWVEKLTLLWINPETRKIEIIPVENRRRDIIKLINHYEETKNW